jgi:hypothetical protein
MGEASVTSPLVQAAPEADPVEVADELLPNVVVPEGDPPVEEPLPVVVPEPPVEVDPPV